MWKQQINAGLVIGFTVALMLMVLIFAVGLTSMSAIQDRLKSIAESQNVKTELATSMRYAARERMLSLYRMLLLEDPFERDEEYMAFNRFALQFITARNQLLEMQLSDEEQRLLNEQGQLTVVAVQLQERVIDFTYRDEINEAKQLLYDKTMAAQEAVFRKLNELTQIQRAATQRAVQESTLEYNRTRNLMYIFGLVAFVIVVIVAVVVIRRAATNEASVFLQKEKLQVTLNSIGDGVITTDADGMVEYVNQVAAQLTGVSNDDAKGMGLFDVLTLVNDEGVPPSTNPVLKAINEQRIIDNYEPMTLVRENGDNYAVELTAAPIEDYDGSIIGAVLVFRNMTAISMWRVITMKNIFYVIWILISLRW